MRQWKLSIAFLIFFGLNAANQGQVITYEGNRFPEEESWERIVFTEIDRFIDEGWFGHFVDFSVENDTYQRRIADFAGVPRFFVEWRVESDAPSVILDTSGIPVVVSAGGMGGHYHFTITDKRVRVIRSNFLPIVFADIESDIPHQYRLELCSAALCGTDRYSWSIDGQVIDSGIAEVPYPDLTSVVLFSTRRQMFDSTTRWDYVRFGVIPQDASGDFDSNEAIEVFDFYFVHECLTNDRIGIHGGPGNDAGPGCRFTDFDGDADVDLCDFAEFQNRIGDPS